MSKLKHIIAFACAGIILVSQSPNLNPASAQTVSKTSRPKVAVVLSGGGAKGVAHISALRAIEQAGIPIDIITGTSMGSLIGGLYAVGWSCDELDSLVRNQEWSFLLTDRVRPEALDIDTRRLQSIYPLWHSFVLNGTKNEGAGVIRGINLDRLFDRLLDGYLDSISFDSLPIPFACVATDVVTNTEIDFRSGYLKQAMRASMSIPGVFSPVRIGNRLLVDGGLRNNYPADIARQMGADIIIGVTVQGDTLTADDITGPLGLFMQIIDINCKNKYNDNIALSDLVMSVDVSGYSAASFTNAAIDTLLRRGAEEAARHRDALLDLRRRNGIDSVIYAHPQVSEENKASNSGNPNALTPATYPLLTNPLAGVTFRFDNEETGALQIGAQMPFSWHVPMELAARLRLGKRLQFNIEHRFYPRSITSPSLSYTFLLNDIDIYYKGVRTYNTKYSQHIINLTPINSRFRQYKIRAGLRFDYHDYYDPILSANANAIEFSNHCYLSYFFQSLLNNENDFYFPTSGIHFLVNFSYHTDNFVSLDDDPGIPDLSLLWRVNLSPSDKFTLQPSLFSRMLFRDKIPLAYGNMLGSRQQIVEQQLEFPGVHSLVQAQRYIVGIQLSTQHQVARNHYILGSIAAARHIDELTSFFDSGIDLAGSEFIYGVSLGYAYRSFLGPISAQLGYSTLAPGLNFYINIGHNF